MSPSKDEQVFLADLRNLLAEDTPGENEFLAALDLALNHFDCAVGTIHVLDPQTNMLRLLADRGIPEAIKDRVRQIPIGKGMAGLAAQRLQPVQVCNLQTDESGVAKPAAKLTEMKGSIALPILVDGKLRGTFGVGKPTEYEFTPAETQALLHIAELIGAHLPSN